MCRLARSDPGGGITNTHPVALMSWLGILGLYFLTSQAAICYKSLSVKMTFEFHFLCYVYFV